MRRNRHQDHDYHYDEEEHRHYNEEYVEGKVVPPVEVIAGRLVSFAENVKYFSKQPKLSRVWLRLLLLEIVAGKFSNFFCCSRTTVCVNFTICEIQNCGNRCKRGLRSGIGGCSNANNADIALRTRSPSISKRTRSSRLSATSTCATLTY